MVRHMQVIVTMCLLFAVGGPARATTVITATFPGNVLVATAVDGVIVNGIDYNVTFGFNGFQATVPADLTFLGDAAGAVNATTQLSSAVQAANVEELAAVDFATSETHESNNFVVINTACTAPTCTAPYIGDEGNRTTNGSPWL
jgi:hypothetical protein